MDELRKNRKGFFVFDGLVGAVGDPSGYVGASVPGLARVAGVPVEACRVALGRFLSRGPDYWVPLIEEADGGWVLLDVKCCSRREYMREKKRE